MTIIISFIIILYTLYFYHHYYYIYMLYYYYWVNHVATVLHRRMEADQQYRSRWCQHQTTRTAPEVQ